MSGNSSETARKKNQFDKEERVHLLAIMRQYAPLLERSASTLVRKRIWTIIEEEFKKAGFTRKSSAQLKKYWQNYKYHSKRAKASGKENKKCTVSDDIEPFEWDRHQVFVDNGSTPTKSPEDLEFLRSVFNRLQRLSPKSERRSIETCQDNESSPGKFNASSASIDLSRVKEERHEQETTGNDFETEETNPLKNFSFDQEMLDEKKEIILTEDQLVFSSNNAEAKQKAAENRIVVSNARISNNSVTVSVIYPDDNNEHASNGTIDETLETSSAREAAESSWKECREEESNGPNSILNPNAVHWAPPFDCPNLFERDNDRGNLDRTNGNASNEKVGNTFGSNGSEDSIQTRQMDENLNGRKNNVNVREKCFVTHNKPVRSGGRVFLTDYRNRLRHRLLLQQLEIEEKRLKVKIAEMTFQEVQLRIQALYEDMRRTEELHQLRLLQATTSTGIERDSV